jgi:glycosyltransferase involved in cell wall biosynthesis
MKLLLIGPYPPPHGGISVHVSEAGKKLQQAGFEVRVLNTDRTSTPSGEYLCFRSVGQLICLLWKHARHGWAFHMHTNGHNRNSWLLASLCGMVSKLGPGSFLTLHSGMTPAYLEGGLLRRFGARRVCSLYDRVIGVNVEILNALKKAGVPADKLDVLPAYLAAYPSSELPSQLDLFFQEHWPVFTTVLFFRPEYGFEFLLKGLSRLRESYPKLGCLLMGDGETSVEARLAILKEEIGESISLLGDVSHDLCLALMSRSDAFLRCTFSDGDSISVREALSAGVPVVASDIGHRPAGALLFRAGDLDEFAASVEEALGDRKETSPSMGLQTTEFPRLLEMYKNLRPEEVR